MPLNELIHVGPDTVELSLVSCQIRRTSTRSPEDGPSDLWIAHDADPGNCEWFRNERRGDPGNERVLWTHKRTRVQMMVKNDIDIIWVKANLSRLHSGLSHNGVIVKSENAMFAAVQKLFEIIDPYRETPDDMRLKFKKVEFGTCINVPFPAFESALDGLNYPRLRSAPFRTDGSCIKYGTLKGSEFRVRIYDKGLELLDRHKDMPGHVLPGKWTRIEFEVSKRKLNKSFGGDTLRFVTVKKMRELFEKFLQNMEVMDPREIMDFPADKTGLFAKMIHDHQYIDSDKVEKPEHWWTRMTLSKRRSRALLKCAKKMASQHQGKSLPTLIAKARSVDLR
ncbi:MAG: hypothetical protein JJU29_10535 [Verrucomicrobia bacterium]|nr:hypothetical protein [Verrucomicrobiota bacterium]